MLQALTALLLCQLAGETIVHVAGLPFPGPVLGMAILFAILLARGGVPEEIGRVGDGLLGNLSLLFVPAGAGVMMHLSRLGGEVLPVSVTLVVSTLLTIAVTGLVMKGLSAKGLSAKDPRHGE